MAGVKISRITSLADDIALNLAVADVRMVSLKDRLSRYDLTVAQYYWKRGAWVAAANRSKDIVQNYNDTPAVESALEIMVKSYDKLQMPQMAANARKVLAANYPDNSLARP